MFDFKYLICANIKQAVTTTHISKDSSDTRGLINNEWRVWMFGTMTFICVTWLKECRQDSQSGPFLLPYHHLLSVPVIQVSFQSHAAALTSLPPALPAFCSNPAALRQRDQINTFITEVPKCFHIKGKKRGWIAKKLFYANGASSSLLSSANSNFETFR